MPTFDRDAALYHDPSITAHSPSRAPPSYPLSSRHYGTQYANRDFRGTERELHGNVVVGEMGEGARPPSELLGNTYRPYRLPGAGVQP